jgi:hypothetical protein
MSCEDSQGWVWIEFTHAHDAERFPTAVANHMPRHDDHDHDVDDDDGGVYLRITNPLRPGSWTYEIQAADLNNLDEPRMLPPGGMADFMLSVSVRLPRADHPRVLAAVRGALCVDRAAGDTGRRQRARLPRTADTSPALPGHRSRTPCRVPGASRADEGK